MLLVILILVSSFVHANFTADVAVDLVIVAFVAAAAVVAVVVVGYVVLVGDVDGSFSCWTRRIKRTFRQRPSLWHSFPSAVKASCFYRSWSFRARNTA